MRRGDRARRLSPRRRAQLLRWLSYVLFGGVVAFVFALVDWPRVIDSMFKPRLVAEQFPEIVLTAARNTLLYTALSFSGGLGLGLLFALLRLSRAAPYRVLASVYIETFRGLPALLTILLIGFAIPIATGVRIPGGYVGQGSLGLAVVAGAYMAETIRAGIEAVPRGQMEAARSLGMSSAGAMRHIVVPQAFRIIMPPLTNELVLLLKDTSLIGIALGSTIATRELTKFGRDAVSRTANATPLIVAGLMYLVLTIPLTRLAAALERRGRAAR